MTRRNFIQTSAAAASALAAEAQSNAQSNTPWYRRVTRWGQTNIVERDPVRYDIPWWRAQWKRTGTQGRKNVFVFMIGGEHDNLCMWTDLLDLPRGLYTAYTRHHEVHEYHIRN